MGGSREETRYDSIHEEKFSKPLEHHSYFIWSLVGCSYHSANLMGLKVKDRSITGEVKLMLLYHRSTSILNTNVDTQNGVVKISGKARNAAEKALYTKLVADVAGVKGVVNNMEIEASRKIHFIH